MPKPKQSPPCRPYVEITKKSVQRKYKNGETSTEASVTTKKRDCPPSKPKPKKDKPQGDQVTYNETAENHDLFQDWACDDASCFSDTVVMFEDATVQPTFSIDTTPLIDDCCFV